MEQAIVQLALRKLSSLLIEEGKFLFGVGEKVGELESELKWMDCFLKDANAKQEHGDERVRNWVMEIKEVGYDADDVIDNFIVKVLFRRKGNILKRYACFFGESRALHKVGLEIEATKRKINTLTSRLQTYGVKFDSEGEGDSNTRRQPPRPKLSYPHIIEEDIVGLEEDIIKVVEYLVRVEKQYQAVSLVGMGGMGKTTLAKRVYHHVEVRHHFTCFAWAYVSQSYQTRYILEGILIQLISASREQRKEVASLRDEELVTKLYQVQTEKRCLVIIDDIWQAEAWDELSPAFPCTMAGSKILLTTRNKEVALHVDQRCFVHELRQLSECESWELFETKVYLRNDADFRLSTDMLSLGKEMVRNCTGLPLAIVTLGGLLATKRKLDEWEMVQKNMRHGEVLNVLALSYQDLPYYLKACFLHLGHFPEDHKIGAEKLVRMWVAEGFVPPTTVESCEGGGLLDTMVSVAKGYLLELVGRCMVQVAEYTKLSGRIKSCRLHDLMRDVCLSKAKEENFLRLVIGYLNGNKVFLGGNNLFTSSINCKIRRLAIYLGRKEDVNHPSFAVHGQEYFSQHSRLRSALFFGGEAIDWQYAEQKILKPIVMGFTFLRVLDLEGLYMYGVSLPVEIGNLFHLRYLNLRFSSFTWLPSSIGRLRSLQTLDLRAQRGFNWIKRLMEFHVPNVLWKLEGLRHLYLPSRVDEGKAKLRLDKLSNLEMLENFDSDTCDAKCISLLTNLRELKRCRVRVEELGAILSTPCRTNSNQRSYSLQHSSFSIRGNIQTEEEQNLLLQLLASRHLHKLEIEDCLTKLPEHHQFPSGLTRLLFINTELKDDPMPTLEKLPNLRSLVLHKKSYLGKKLTCSATTPLVNAAGVGGFPRLRFLILTGLNNLVEWNVDEGAMMSLLHLVIEDCKKLKRIPEGLRFISSLKELEIIRMPEAFRNRIRRGGEDFHKVQHVPSISTSAEFYARDY